ncbi:MAG: ATP-binding protein [Acidobacteriota bacterium]
MLHAQTPGQRLITAVLMLFAVAVMVMGAVNVARKTKFKPPYDGAEWEYMAPEAGGLRQLRCVWLDPKGPAYKAGIARGDVLLSINGENPRTGIEVTKWIWEAGIGARADYQVRRGGEVHSLALVFEPRPREGFYYYLAFVGCFSIGVGLILLTRRSGKPFTVHFFLLTLAMFSLNIFSFTGEFNWWDHVFYWADRLAFWLFPPVLLHFFISFPKKKPLFRLRPGLVPGLYAPAIAFASGEILMHVLFYRGVFSEAAQLRVLNALDTLALVNMGATLLAAIGALVHSWIYTTNVVFKKQLRWITLGIGAGYLPFVFFYVIPYALGYKHSPLLESTVLFQIFVPLTFAYAITRYRLMDVEVIFKRGLTFGISSLLVFLLYLTIARSTGEFFLQDSRARAVLAFLAILLGATVFAPLYRAVQSFLDRLFYRTSYDYRRTLLQFSKRISAERDLGGLIRTMTDLISKALSIDHVALLLPNDPACETFQVHLKRGEQVYPIGSKPFMDPTVVTRLKQHSVLTHTLNVQETSGTFSIKNPPIEDLNFPQYLALKAEDRLIGILALDRKSSGELLNSEDWELLQTLAAPAALALENAALYRQSQERADQYRMLKEYSENIIESLNVGVMVTDLNTQVIGWNKSMEDLLQKQKQDVTGRAAREVIPEQLLPNIMFFTKNTPSSLDLKNSKRVTLDLAGERKILQVSSTPLLDPQIQPYGTVTILEDVSDVVRLEEQLATTDKLASIGVLAAGVAHELNTPLTGISSYAQMLKQDAEANGASQQILEKIEKQTGRASRIIQSLLNFAREGDVPVLEEVNVNDVILDAVSLVEHRLNRSRIQLHRELGTLAPVQADASKLQQVFLNLFVNAADAMPQGGKLRVCTRQLEDGVEITVQDSGEGIKEEDLARIYDPFFTTKRDRKGTGLGLAVSYGIIRQHGGAISVDSQPGKGTAFTILMPKHATSETLRRIYEGTAEPVANRPRKP